MKIMTSILYIKSEQLNPENEKQVFALRMLCNLEISITNRRWFKDDSLKEHEKIIANIMCHASLAEAMHLFQKSVDMGVISKNEEWDLLTLNNWDYLFSEEVNVIKQDVLKYIRDKTAFHIDPETVKDFMSIEKDKKQKLSIFHMTSEEEGHSTMVTSILSFKLFEKLLSNGEGIITGRQLEKITKLQNALQSVINSILMEEFEISEYSRNEEITIKN